METALIMKRSRYCTTRCFDVDDKKLASSCTVPSEQRRYAKTVVLKLKFLFHFFCSRFFRRVHISVDDRYSLPALCCIHFWFVNCNLGNRDCPPEATLNVKTGPRQGSRQQQHGSHPKNTLLPSTSWLLIHHILPSVPLQPLASPAVYTIELKATNITSTNNGKTGKRRKRKYTREGLQQ